MLFTWWPFISIFIRHLDNYWSKNILCDVHMLLWYQRGGQHMQARCVFDRRLANITICFEGRALLVSPLTWQLVLGWWRRMTWMWPLTFDRSIKTEGCMSHWWAEVKPIMKQVLNIYERRQIDGWHFKCNGIYMKCWKS